jgi:glycosyltransferase involved in cell wall biosynthesis
VRILLVTHEASRSGAPRVAVLVARSLGALGHHVDVVTRAAGPLVADFAQVAPTSEEPFGRLRRRLWRARRLRRLAWVLDTAVACVMLLLRRPDLVYVNSTAAAVYLRPARWLGRPTLLHVHESGTVAGEFLDRARAPRALAGTRLVACSPSVRTGLVELSGRGADEVVLLPSVPDDADVLRRAQEPPDRSYRPDELVVGCCGSVERRKGADLWVEVAGLVRAALPGTPVRFVWVGDVTDPVDQRASGDPVDFVGPSANPYAHMRRFDVATLPSRDDPFPLVVLESMLVATPVVAFAVGSVSDQVGDAGRVVAPEDTRAFAAEVVALLVDADERRRLGRAGHDRAMTLYSTRAFADGLASVLPR